MVIHNGGFHLHITKIAQRLPGCTHLILNADTLKSQNSKPKTPPNRPWMGSSLLCQLGNFVLNRSIWVYHYLAPLLLLLFDHFYNVYIDNILNNIIYILVSCSQHFTSNKESYHKSILGWNDYLKVKFYITCKTIVTWKNTGQVKK